MANCFGNASSPCEQGGTLSLVSAVGGKEIGFAYELLRPLTLTGYSIESLDGSALRDAMAPLTRWLLNGGLKPPAYRMMPLAEAAQAHALLERKGISGRALLVP